MNAKQIVDTLPSYISLYNNSSLSSNPPPPSPDRIAILKWFSSLSPSHRLSHLTILDFPFTQILLRMLSHLKPSHSTFFLLPDIPSSENPQIPSLCARKSLGLLARVADSSESTRLITSSLRLFSSKEGDDSECLDTVSFSEGFVEDVGKFVEAMDSASDSGFLNGSDWGELGSDWVELGWLKAKGYYSMEAFVANRMEVALRLAWLNGSSNNGGGKKRGVKLKEKASSVVGVGANVHWRKRGCIEWWERLDDGVKTRAFQMLLGHAAKYMSGEILKGVDGILEDNWLHFGNEVEQPLRYSISGPSVRGLLQRDARLGLSLNRDSSSKIPTSLLCAMNKLCVVQIVVAMASDFRHNKFDKEKLFFSSLDSVNTISDRILRKLRGLLMLVSLDSARLELLEGDNQMLVANKSKGKTSATSRKKKKNRNAKKINPSSKNCEEGSIADKTLKVAPFNCSYYA